jgi:exonuclease III
MQVSAAKNEEYKLPCSIACVMQVSAAKSEEYKLPCSITCVMQVVFGDGISGTSPHSPSMAHLRLATYNIRRAFPDKLANILNMARREAWDVVALQEIENRDLSHLVTDRTGYRMVAALAPHTGVALLVATRISTHRVKVLTVEDKPGLKGRMIGYKIRLNGLSYLFVSVYLPTGLDYKPAGSGQEGVQIADELYDMVHSWSKGMDKVFVMGDNNESMEHRGRRPRHPKSGWNVHMAALTMHSFIDTFRAVNPDQDGFTCLWKKCYSRIDHILAYGITDRDIENAGVIDHTAYHITSDHWPLFCTISLPSDIPDYKRERISLPNMKKATEEQKKSMTSRMERLVEESMMDISNELEGKASQLDALGEQLIEWANTAAKCIPTTGGKPFAVHAH